jgi:hypothetical protein
LEIFVSIGNRLAFNVRFESADDGAEIVECSGSGHMAENPFSFDPETVRDGRTALQANSPPTRYSASYYAVSVAFSYLSAPVGESVDSALDLCLEGEWHLCSRRWADGLTASCDSFRPVATGVLFIPFVAWDPCASMSEELWLIHVTEPVTETIS